MKPIIAFISIICCASTVQAQSSYSVGQFRMFSRANCASVNESITWSPYGYIAYLETYSGQTKVDGSHDFYYSNKQLAQRSRAGCQFCSLGGYHVIGHHYLSGPIGWEHQMLTYDWDRDSLEICDNIMNAGLMCRMTSTTDCSISSGWF